MQCSYYLVYCSGGLRWVWVPYTALPPSINCNIPECPMSPMHYTRNDTHPLLGLSSFKHIRQQSRQQAPYTVLGVVGCATARAAPLKAPSTTIVLVLYLSINPPVALSKLTLQQTVFSYCTLIISHLSQLSSLSSSITSVVSVSGLP